MRKLILGSVVAIAAVVIIQSCSKSGGGSKPAGNSSFDRKGMLTNIANNLIIPAYTAFQTDAAALDDAAKAFAASPDADKLTALQTAFQSAYKQWQATSEYDLGPAAQIDFRVNTNTYPIDMGQINANINSGTYNPVLLSNLAAKGLPALDYLLFGTGTDNNAILAQYTTDGKAANRKVYLTGLTAELKTNATTVLSGWNSGYKNTFINNDGTDQGSSTGLLLNQLVYDYEILKNYEIGIPAGVQSMGTTFPQKVQAYYSKMSVQLALLHIQAIQNLYTGNTGLGFDDYLTQANAKYSDGTSLNTTINNQFATSIGKLHTLTDPLSDNIVSNNTAVTATYTELQKLTVLLKNDMPSSLGILITFGDNDGD